MEHRRDAASTIVSTAFSAPRALNEPVTWSDSSLRNTSPPEDSLSRSDRTRGVRRTRPGDARPRRADVVERDADH